MLLNRFTKGIVFNEEEITNVMSGFNNKKKSTFLDIDELKQKASDGQDFRGERPGVDYTKFGKYRTIK